MSRHRIAVLSRMKDMEGRTLCFTIPAITRRRLLDYIDKDRVPDFEGDAATFEIEQVREPDCPWPRWRVLRQVHNAGEG